MSQHSAPRQTRCAPLNSPITEKNWSDCRLTGKAVNRAQAHPAATVPITGHATTILHTLELAPHQVDEFEWDLQPGTGAGPVLVPN